MKKLTRFSALLLVALLGLSACNSSEKKEEQKTEQKTEQKAEQKAEQKTEQKAELMKGETLLEEQKSGALVVDVRKPEQYNEGHIKDAKNVPLASIETEFEKVEANKDKKIILYCNTGNQSGQALEKLKKMGYTNVHNAQSVKQYKYELVK